MQGENESKFSLQKQLQPREPKEQAIEWKYFKALTTKT